MTALRILIAGGDGQLGQEFAHIAVPGVELIRCSRSELDITDPASIANAFAKYHPQVVINAAAYTAVDRAESDAEQAFAINANGAGHLAFAAETHSIPLLHVSTDYVFSGDKPEDELWAEEDICEPRSVYGHSKLIGEQQVMDDCSRALVLRTSWVFGRFGNNFPKTMLRLARERDELRVVGDQFGCPTHAGDIAATLVQAAQAMVAGKLESGIYHYAGAPACTWHAFAEQIIETAFAKGMIAKKPRVIAIATHEYPVAAVRPVNSVMDCSKLNNALGIASPQWQHGLDVLLDHLK
ncbi:MAG TPA: dTDP-4-dehydrorhamnose reductase [Pseudomonadales bacterium]|nr:dTDP-4-dehydrorhamnose reductase [Pseudomonadales bacterium]